MAAQTKDCAAIYNRFVIVPPLKGGGTIFVAFPFGISMHDSEIKHIHSIPPAKQAMEDRLRYGFPDGHGL